MSYLWHLGGKGSLLSEGSQELRVGSSQETGYDRSVVWSQSEEFLPSIKKM